MAKLQRPSILTIAAAVFIALAVALAFFTPFGPISQDYILFQPMGWAGMFVYLAMLCVYSQRYRQTKDNFWFILAVMFLPVLVSDLYFFPIPEIQGFGMLDWMGVQVLVTFACFTAAAKIKAIRYSNASMLLLSIPGTVLYLFPQPSLSTPALALFILFFVTIAATLSYYAYQRREYLLILGAILNFVVSIPIATMYLTSAYLPFGWSHLMMATVTDRIALFGRILMTLSPLAVSAFLAKTRKLEQV